MLTVTLKWDQKCFFLRFWEEKILSLWFLKMKTLSRVRVRNLTPAVSGKSLLPIWVLNVLKYFKIINSWVFTNLYMFKTIALYIQTRPTCFHINIPEPTIALYIHTRPTCFHINIPEPTIAFYIHTRPTCFQINMSEPTYHWPLRFCTCVHVEEKSFPPFE